jgi:hypothetical protein
MSNFDLSDDALALELVEQSRGRFAYDHRAKRCRKRPNFHRNKGWKVAVASISRPCGSLCAPRRQRSWLRRTSSIAAATAVLCEGCERFGW